MAKPRARTTEARKHLVVSGRSLDPSSSFEVLGQSKDQEGDVVCPACGRRFRSVPTDETLRIGASSANRMAITRRLPRHSRTPACELAVRQNTALIQLQELCLSAPHWRAIKCRAAQSYRHQRLRLIHIALDLGASVASVASATQMTCYDLAEMIRLSPRVGKII